MSLLLKDLGAVLDYSIDWGQDYLAEDRLAASVWTVEPNEAGGIAVADDKYDELVTTVTVNGGVAGRVYRLTNAVTTEAGLVDRRSVTLRVEAR